MTTDSNQREKISYDPKTVRQTKNSLIQALKIIRERGEKLKGGQERKSLRQNYIMISRTADRLSKSIDTGLELNQNQNKFLLNVYNTAEEIFNDRVLKMHKYYIKTTELIIARNEKIDE